MVPRSGVDRFGKSHPDGNSILEPFSAEQIAIPAHVVKRLRDMFNSFQNTGTSRDLCRIMPIRSLRNADCLPLAVGVFVHDAPLSSPFIRPLTLQSQVTVHFPKNDKCIVPVRAATR